MVSVAGISFGIVVVLMTITFLCYHRVSASHRPRKTQVGQVLLRPRGNGNPDPRARRADGASASFWSDRTASPADSPTRTYLLTSSRTGAAPRQPGYYVDAPFCANEVLEANVNTLGRPCPAYRIYGFPAYCGTPQGEMVTGCYYDAPPCVTCNQRRGQGPAVACVGCPEHAPAGHGYGGPLGEVFIDGPPPPGSEAVGTGRRRTRPPTEGSDSEMTPVRTVPLSNGGAVIWKRPDHEDVPSNPRSWGTVRPENKPDPEEKEGTYVDLRGTVRPLVSAGLKGSDREEGKRPDHKDLESSPRSRGTVRPVASTGLKGTDEEGKRPDHDEGAPRRTVRPDGQSPDSGETEPVMTKSAKAASCSTLSDLDTSAADELEYDDYIPQLPGSYFEMDPHAYTLTWSQQGSSDRKQPPQNSLSASEASLDCR